MGFGDRMVPVTDDIIVALNCGLCGEVADEGHACTKRYFRKPAMVQVREVEKGQYLVLNDGEKYVVGAGALAAHYEEIL